MYRLFLALSNLDANGFDADAGELKPFLLPLSIIWSINSRVSGGNSNEASSSLPLPLSAGSSDDDFGGDECGWYGGTNANAGERPTSNRQPRIFC